VVMSPYLSTINNVIMNINESMFLVVGASFFAFINTSEDQSRTKLLGMIVMGLIMFVISVN